MVRRAEEMEADLFPLGCWWNPDVILNVLPAVHSAVEVTLFNCCRSFPVLDVEGSSAVLQLHSGPVNKQTRRRSARAPGQDAMH